MGVYFNSEHWKSQIEDEDIFFDDECVKIPPIIYKYKNETSKIIKQGDKITLLNGDFVFAKEDIECGKLGEVEY